MSGITASQDREHLQKALVEALGLLIELESAEDLDGALDAFFVSLMDALDIPFGVMFRPVSHEGGQTDAWRACHARGVDASTLDIVPHGLFAIPETETCVRLEHETTLALLFGPASPGIRSAWLVPVRASTRCLGVFALGRADGEALTGPARDLLEVAAALLARILERRYSMANGDQTKFLTALESAGDAVEITDAEARIEYVNAAFERQTGWPREDALGKTPAELFRAGQHSTEFYDAISGELRAGRTWQGEITGRRRDGTLYPQHMTVAPVLDLEGRIAHCVAIKRDMSSFKQLQAKLMQADRMTAMGIIASGVGHEINNPLAYVLGNVEFALERLPALAERLPRGALDDVKLALSEAIAGAQRARAIAKDLLCFARVDDDGSYETVELRPILEAALRMAQSELRHKATVVTDFQAVPPVKGGESKLVQVFLNLLINAAQALQTARDARVLVRIRPFDGDLVYVDVIDNGSGIPAENLSRIFDPFFTTKPLGIGTGLGLAICRAIVEAAGGSITVSSVLGEGTTITIALPAALDRASPSPVTPEPEPSSVRLRVLVIDDEPPVCRVIQRMLRGHDVVVSGLPDDVVDVVCSGGFDVVLCDLMMPGRSGMQIYKDVKQRNPALLERIVFMTGGACTDDAERFLSSLPTPVLRKPFVAAALRRVIARLAT